ncbi:dihydroorotase [Magnetospira sp. QH-2]|uniref:dihydroorotase n=1 Tax=Magnetospira sp. (strain QH-2) TaxID=1288970 RepID=UPI0003E8171A|nr:dihydroorotase [Magnetospira sp. QH-2]CCQ73893.1 Allantoinase [Magnetospira sp. QH-2]
MTQPFDLILHGGSCMLPGGEAAADIGIRYGRIAAIGDLGAEQAVSRFDVSGLHVLPGVIDSQVHMREPGLEHKEDFATGTLAAVLGGVTAVMEMPNTKPNTTTAEALADKARRAKDRAWCDMAFFIGAAGDNTEKLAELERLPSCSGVKVFMGSSTGTLLVEDDASLAQVLANGTRRVAVHCEDEPRLRERFSRVEGGASVSMHPVWRDAETARLATERLLKLARGTGRRVHVLHITTADEMALLPDFKDLATVEVTPQHLTLSAPEAYERLGSLAQMNPPIREESHRLALWKALEQGVVDCIGSDHAPHTSEEKAQDYPASPSGMPGVQTLVPILLDHVNAGRLSLQRFVDLTSAGPARIYGVAGKGRIALGYDADLTIVNLKAQRTITNQWIASRCGWTPFDGMKVTGWPEVTLVRGNVVMRDGQTIGDPVGSAIRFQECL